MPRNKDKSCSPYSSDDVVADSKAAMVELRIQEIDELYCTKIQK